MKLSGVYVITNTKTFKVYIGSSYDINYRFGRHRRELNDNCHHSRALQRAWDKYGNKNFIFEILERCSIKQLIKREQYWLDQFNSYHKYYGYNICKLAGSSIGIKRSKEHCKQHAKRIKKIWKDKKYRYKMKIIHSSKSFRNKMRKIALRREHDLKFIARRKKLNQTVEYKAIMKRAAIARYNDPDYCKKMQKIWQLRKKVA